MDFLKKYTKRFYRSRVAANALALEIRKNGLDVFQQHGVSVYYDGIVLGEYYADLMGDKSVLVELKAVKSIDEVHFAKCLNYLKATGFRICLLLNFGAPKVEIKCIIYIPEINLTLPIG